MSKAESWHLTDRVRLVLITLGIEVTRTGTMPDTPHRLRHQASNPLANEVHVAPTLESGIRTAMTQVVGSERGGIGCDDLRQDKF